MPHTHTSCVDVSENYDFTASHYKRRGLMNFKRRNIKSCVSVCRKVYKVACLSRIAHVVYIKMFLVPKLIKQKINYVNMLHMQYYVHGI